MLRVRLWGTRGSIASPGRATWRYGGNTSCVQVIGFEDDRPGAAMPANHPHLILDGGTGLTALQAMLMGENWGQGRGELHMLLTHYHWDHLIGLPFFKPMFVRGNRIVFYGASVDDLQSSIEHLFTSVYSPLDGTQNVAADLEYRRIEPEGMEISGFQVRAAPTRHTAATLAFRIQYGACGLVYATDHGAGDARVDAGLVELARGANLWILDAQYTPQELEDFPDRGHTSHLGAVELALQAGVDTVVLFHHDPTHDDETLDHIAHEASKLAAGRGLQVLMARDGMALELR